MQARAFILINELISFLRKPTRRHPRRVGVKARLVAIFTLLGLNTLFTLLVCVPIMFLLNRMIGLDIRPGLQTSTFMFSAVLFAPVLEECMFRAGLRSITGTLYVMPVMIAVLSKGWKIPLCTAVVAGLAWLVDRSYRRRLSADAVVRNRWGRGRLFIRNYGAIVYVYACLFAAAHFSNFMLEDGGGWKSVLLILAVMSQLMNGLTYSFLRLRYGLPSSMAAHFLWNACAVSISVLAR